MGPNPVLIGKVHERSLVLLAQGCPRVVFVTSLVEVLNDAENGCSPLDAKRGSALLYVTSWALVLLIFEWLPTAFTLRWYLMIAIW